MTHAAALLDEATQPSPATAPPPRCSTSSCATTCAFEQRSAPAALRRSAIFPVTALDQFDFDAPKEIDKDLVTKAAELSFIEDKTNCVFLGSSSGVGKTHLAYALGVLACLRGYRVRLSSRPIS